MALRRTELHQRAIRFVETAFRRRADSPLVVALLSYAPEFDLADLLWMDTATLDGLSIPNPFAWVPGEPLELAIDADDRNLIRLLQYFALYRRSSGNPIDWFCQTPVKAAEFDDFRANSSLRWQLNLEPTTKFTLSSYLPTCVDRLSSAYPILSDDLLFDE